MTAENFDGIDGSDPNVSRLQLAQALKWMKKEIGIIKPWIIVSFHPAFLMRQPQQKKLAWIDLKMIRDKIKTLSLHF